jgi:predicted membrane metal-binding protein
MNSENIWIKLIEKIELQSILVLLITLFIGIYLFTFNTTFPNPTAILGSVLIGFGALYTLVSFFTNNIRESYKDIIQEYKDLGQEVSKSYKKLGENYERQLGINGTDTLSSLSVEQKTTRKYKPLVKEQKETPN